MRTMGSASLAALPSTAMESTANAVRAVRSLRTVAELIEAVPRVVGSLGFDRIIFSDITDRVWMPLDVYMPRDAGWGKEILEAGRTTPSRIDAGLIENELLRSRRPIVVEGVQGHPRVNQPIAIASRSDAYMAVPVIVGDVVGAFIHVDRYWGGGRFDNRDATQVEVVANALGMALERAHLTERLQGLAAAMDLDDVMQRRLHERSQQPKPVERHLYACLTQRENDVAELISAGLTNRQIADTLVLSEATIKSHVKHILRKLGAGHRAEAVAMLLRND